MLGTARRSLAGTVVNNLVRAHPMVSSFSPTCVSVKESALQLLQSQKRVVNVALKFGCAIPNAAGRSGRNALTKGSVSQEKAKKKGVAIVGVGPARAPTHVVGVTGALVLMGQVAKMERFRRRHAVFAVRKPRLAILNVSGVTLVPVKTKVYVRRGKLSRRSVATVETRPGHATMAANGGLGRAVWVPVSVRPARRKRSHAVPIAL